MLFNSQAFLLVFLPVALLVHALTVPRRGLWISATILLSMAFYAAWDVALLPILLCSIAANWAFARVFEATGRRTVLAVGIVLNLLVLAYFKYANFILANLGVLWGHPLGVLAVALPLGISFFTFQQVAYLVDLGRGTAKPHGLMRYALYVSFFPHLIAGPLLRHSEFFASLDAPRDEARAARLFGQGLILIAIGLWKKVMVADGIGFAVDQLFTQAAAGPLQLGASWMAAIGFSLQIYFDFSGYSDIAIGLGFLFGIVIPFNFDAPYKATSIIDFWRVWHMTLSRLLRDYVYIPFGGSRFGLERQMGALLATMLIGGLWHGAGWNFVIWGGLHGLALVINHLWRNTGRALPSPLAWMLTFLFVVVTFVIFRAASMDVALSVLGGLTGWHGTSLTVILADQGWRPPFFGSIQAETLVLCAFAFLIAVLGPTSQSFAMERVRPGPLAALLTAVALIVAIVAVGGGGGAEFVYFQF